jgi:hypothetical protein
LWPCLLFGCHQARDTRRDTLARFFAAIVEGMRNADRYQRLARKTYAELTQLGVRRQDLPHIGMFGMFGK